MSSNNFHIFPQAAPSPGRLFPARKYCVDTSLGRICRRKGPEKGFEIPLPSLKSSTNRSGRGFSPPGQEVKGGTGISQSSKCRHGEKTHLQRLAGGFSGRWAFSTVNTHLFFFRRQILISSRRRISHPVRTGDGRSRSPRRAFSSGAVPAAPAFARSPPWAPGWRRSRKIPLLAGKRRMRRFVPAVPSCEMLRASPEWVRFRSAIPVPHDSPQSAPDQWSCSAPGRKKPLPPAWVRHRTLPR